eukprot:CAMPEP_0202378256 /NCGR_PEP_ID=MMETSP1127-20130417/17472_1 /ASSEMBLY_ACC=CAM_ASM_000462 /TAXON_ID=3047 /ORGANISM="Dunaliella tertiolecta, Strain CCMP1320" /LENGTH=122 /DNA_ID=CAMNT_0048976519 /DNA_START=83 /DNA_END=451 /DNA_ORIENTATION=+
MSLIQRCSSAFASSSSSLGSSWGPSLARLFATVSITASNPTEKDVAERIAAALKGSKRIEVEDVSGGCGAMYRIEVEASDFKGLPIVKQHQAVAAILKDDIAKWHGMQLTTRASEPQAPVSS